MDLINEGVAAKLLAIMNDSSQSERVKMEAVIVLGSLAKGGERNVNVILSADALPILKCGMRLPTSFI